MKADPTTGTLLSAKGFRVHPLTQYKKSPSYNGWASAGERAVRNKMTTETGVTGWAIQPTPNDPTQIIILDIDNYGVTLDGVADMLFPMDRALPANTGVVHTPSGGFHLYFKYPHSCLGRELPTKFDIGGIRGEIRCSARGHALIVLPGSVVPSKETQELNTYTAATTINPPALCEMPLDLWNRLCAAVNPRKGPDAETVGQEPTEIMHIKNWLRKIEPNSQGQGDWCDWAQELGKVYGRIWQRDAPDENSIMVLWDIVEPTYKKDGKGTPDFALFRKNFNSGWTVGRSNADKYKASQAVPTESAVLAEFEAVFGDIGWLQENVDLHGKRSCYVLGLGGSPDAPHLAARSKIQALGDPTEVLGVFARLSVSCDADILARSPLFVQAGWFKVLRLALQRELKQNCISAAPDLELAEKLIAQARDAAESGRIGRGLRSAEPEHADAEFWLQRISMGKYTLIGKPPAVKYMLALLPPECQSYLKDISTVKRDSGGTLWRVPVDQLEDENLIHFLEHHFSRLEEGSTPDDTE